MDFGIQLYMSLLLWNLSNDIFTFYCVKFNFIFVTYKRCVHGKNNKILKMGFNRVLRLLFFHIVRSSMW